jgi:hypothetical protein
VLIRRELVFSGEEENRDRSKNAYFNVQKEGIFCDRAQRLILLPSRLQEKSAQILMRTYFPYHAAFPQKEKERYHP